MNEVHAQAYPHNRWATLWIIHLRALTVVDNYTRESLAIEVGQSLKGEEVVDTLNRIATRRGLPSIIKVDNGSEFISKVMDKWAYERGIELDFSRRANSRTTPRWKASMADCGRSASMPTGSCLWRTPGARLTSGGSTTMRCVPTLHYSGQHPLNSPAGQGKTPCPAGKKSRNFLLLTDTDPGVGSRAGIFCFRPVLIRV